MAPKATLQAFLQVSWASLLSSSETVPLTALNSYADFAPYACALSSACVRPIRRAPYAPLSNFAAGVRAGGPVRQRAHFEMLFLSWIMPEFWTENPDSISRRW